ncbi:hypothetical protein FHS95_002641 [Sphingomonas naasensis]|uniref:Uncharacterized protein n=1 Tax=Sphingomonas naasensis TaxID=1344951 RepID=A0A4S1WLM8_9SPHN|nr:hypothetical protein [Sphingomonas naasensis]NIJ20949.1 hypothetical protein [Sphingomonas naasensis]TGX43335.1 hypothetical protein E5A74_09235 [Sphingomonas naasensis]
MSRGPDAATQLERALVAAAAAAGCPIAVTAADWTRWASATFTGARHSLTLTAGASPLLEQWLVGLSDAEFALRGTLVADIHVVRMTREDGVVTVALEALTVEER